MDEALGQGPFTLLVDLGTGTGRILELFARPRRPARSASTSITTCWPMPA